MFRRSMPILTGLVVAVSLARAAAVAAQSSAPVQLAIPPADAVQELVLRDGSILYGRVVELTEPFRFQLLSGQVVEVRISDVDRLRVARGRAVGGRFRRSDANGTRLFFGPTGRMVPRGDGYLSVFEIIFPIVAVGVSDRFTLAGGTPLFVGEGMLEIVWLAPKIGVYRSPGVDIAAGVLAFFSGGENESMGITYAIGSFGDPDRALHVGIGYGYVGRKIGSRPAIMVGGELRGEGMVKVLSENYFLPGGYGIASVGIRLIGDRVSADLGLAAPLGSETTFFAFPLVNFAWSW